MTNLQRSLGNYDIFFLGTYPSTGFFRGTLILLDLL